MVNAAINFEVRRYEIEDVLRKLAAIGRRVPDQAARNAMSKLGRYAAREMRSSAPRESGALKASMGSKVIKGTRINGYIAVIGPRRGAYGGKSKPYKSFTRGVIRKRSGKFRAATKKELAAGKAQQYRVPANYAHLVEEGHRIVPRRSKGAMKADYFGKFQSKRGNWYKRKVKVGMRDSSGDVPARPFMKPVHQRLASTAADMVAGWLWADLQRRVDGG